MNMTIDKVKYSPWGAIQQTVHYAEGIQGVSTASHGGIKLDRKRNALIPAPFRNKGGWYEEDAEAAIPMYFLYDHIQERRHWNMTRDEIKLDVRDEFPHEWEAYCGEKVPASESKVIAQEQFEIVNRERFVACSAWGDWHKNVPRGYVVCLARRASDMAEAYFTVSLERYDARLKQAVRFHVIDETIDKRMDSFEQFPQE